MCPVWWWSESAATAGDQRGVCGAVHALDRHGGVGPQGRYGVRLQWPRSRSPLDRVRFGNDALPGAASRCYPASRAYRAAAPGRIAAGEMAPGGSEAAQYARACGHGAGGVAQFRLRVGRCRDDRLGDDGGRVAVADGLRHHAVDGLPLLCVGGQGRVGLRAVGLEPGVGVGGSPRPRSGRSAPCPCGARSSRPPAWSRPAPDRSPGCRPTGSSALSAPGGPEFGLPRCRSGRQRRT